MNLDSLKKGFYFLLGLALLGGSLYLFLRQPAPAQYQPSESHKDSTTTTHTLRVGGYVLPIEIADTEEARERGFSGREKPESGHGILFAFNTPGIYGFWMKDMLFPLDIIWINEDWTVVSIEKGVTPESYPKIFTPATAVQYVLELPAGDADALGIDTGVKLYLDR